MYYLKTSITTCLLFKNFAYLSSCQFPRFSVIIDSLGQSALKMQKSEREKTYVNITNNEFKISM